MTNSRWARIEVQHSVLASNVIVLTSFQQLYIQSTSLFLLITKISTPTTLAKVSINLSPEIKIKYLFSEVQRDMVPLLYLWMLLCVYACR